MNIKTIKAKEGTEIVEIIDNEKIYRLNSIYNPYAEAERYAAQFKDSDCKVLLVFGCGNGIFPLEISKICDSDMKIIFYEPFIDMEKYFRSCSGWGTICSNDNVYIVLSEAGDKNNKLFSKSNFSKLLDEVINYSNYNNVRYIALPQYNMLFRDEYANFKKVIQYRIQRIKANITTAKDMGVEAVVNNVMNLKYVPNSFCADSFVGAFPDGMPAIIVSAGPSLEKNVHHLVKLKGNAVIMCVDTAVGYLVKNNIIPDMIICVDAMKPLSIFADDKLKGIPMVVSSDVNYKVIERMEGSPVIFASTENPYFRSLYNTGGHIISKLKSGGSVATLAFSLCRYWGFSDIIFVGQDLALTEGVLYAGNVENSVVPDAELRKQIEVEAVNGNTILTTYDYYSYLFWFEQEISDAEGLNVIDATEGGALIHGTRIMKLEDVADLYNTKSKFSFSVLLREMPYAFNKTQQKMIYKRILNSKKNLIYLNELLQNGIEAAEQVLMLFNQMEEKGEFTHWDNIIESCNSFYNSMEENFLIQRIIDSTELDHFMSIFENIDNLEVTERYKRLKEYYECILRALSVVIKEWDNLLIDYKER